MLFERRIKRQEILEFNKSLSLLLYAKMGFVDALDIVFQQVRNKQFKAIVKDILKNVRTGMTISASFSRHKQIFPEVFIATLKVGEETGEIASVISEYTRYSEKIERVKQKALIALRYPIFVLMVTFITLFFMVWFLIPNFESVFVSFGKDIPDLSKAVFSIAAWLREHVLYLILTPVIVLYGGWRYFGKQKILNTCMKIVPYIPLASRLYKINLLSRFSFTMNTLLSNRVTLVDALAIAKGSSKNPFFVSEIEKIQKSLVKGQNFSHVLGKSKFFDITFIKLLTAAEGASELDKAFLMTADFYTSEFDDLLDTLTSFMEPALILFIGAFVGTIVVALYLPMFELLNNFGF